MCVLRNPLRHSTVCSHNIGVVMCWASSGLRERVDSHNIRGLRRSTGKELPEITKNLQWYIAIPEF